VLTIYRQLCHGLSHIHQLGLVHRDVKPLNVCLSHDLVPVLMDFGLATRTQGGIGREALAAPISGGILGTIPYVSPEQIRGEVADARADLYSLGCMLYESLVGWPPFHGSEARAILQSHLHDAASPLSEHVTGVPAALERVVMQLLAKARHERLGHAEDVAAVLAGLGTDTAAEVLSALPSGTRPYLYPPRLVGRESALDIIRAAQQQLDRGSGALLLIGGESGIGKTSIATEAAQQAARRDFEIVTAECERLGERELHSEQGGAPFQPFRSLLQRVVDYCHEQPAPSQLQLAPGDAQLLSRYEPSLASVDSEADSIPASLPPGTAKQHVYRAVQRVLAALARVRPLVWVLDDLQWADELSVAFLASLSRDFLRQHRLLIIATYRSDEIGGALRRLLDAGCGERLTLDKLDRSAIEAMVQDMLAMPTAPPLLVDFLTRAARGNPFFVAEFLRVTAGEGLLRRNAGQWQLSAALKAGAEGSLEQVPLPDTLKELMQRRIGRLTPESRAVLSVASVLGVEVEIELLTRIQVEAVLDPLAALAGEQLLEPGAPGHVRFAHSQLRDFTYSLIEGALRTRLHERAVRALEHKSRTATHRPHLYPTLAHHWAAAQHPLRAGAYFLRSGNHAHAQYAHHDAIRFYQSASEVLSSAPSRTAGALRALLLRGTHERLGDVLATSGAPERAEQHFSFAIDLGSAKESFKIARLHRKLARARTARHQHERALEAFDAAAHALDVVDAENEAPERFTEWVEIQLGRAWAYYWTQNSPALDELLPALGPLVKRRGTVAQLAQYHEAVCFAELRRDRYAVSDESLSVIRRAARWVGAATLSRASASIHFALGFALVLHGSHAEACKELESVVSFAERTGDLSLRVRALTYLGVACRRLGRIDKAHLLAQQTIELATQHSLDHYLGAGKAILGWVLYRRDRPAEAARELFEALECWKRAHITYPFQGLALWPLGAVLEAQGRHGEALALLRPLSDPAQQALPAKLEACLASCPLAATAELRAVLQLARDHQLL
jgi:tetratricopeptide (TPR) repeat protein